MLSFSTATSRALRRASRASLKCRSTALISIWTRLDGELGQDAHDAHYGDARLFQRARKERCDRHLPGVESARRVRRCGRLKDPSVAAALSWVNVMAYDDDNVAETEHDVAAYGATSTVPGS